MVKTIEAVFDGKVLRPEDPLALEPNTRVRITVETMESSTKERDILLGYCSLAQLGRPARLGGEHRRLS